MKKLLIAAVGASILAFGSIALAQWESHEHLKAAFDHVEEALGELKTANDGKKQYGGHRDTGRATSASGAGRDQSGGGVRELTSLGLRGLRLKEAPHGRVGVDAVSNPAEN